MKNDPAGFLALLKTRDGNLKMVLTPDGKSEVAEMLQDDSRGTDAQLLDLLEYELCNGWSLVLPEEIGALTSAILLSDDVVRSDTGELEACAKVYIFDQYQVISPIQELHDKGYMVWRGV